MFCFLAVWAGPGRAWAPAPKQQKKQHAPAQTAKKITPEKPKQQKKPDNKKTNYHLGFRDRGSGLRDLGFRGIWIVFLPTGS